MRVSLKCASNTDSLMNVDFEEEDEFVLEEWINCLKKEKNISDGLNSIKFLKFDQILQQQLYNISFPMICFRFFGASKTTRKLSKPPKIITMDGFYVRTESCEQERVILDIRDFVFFVRSGIDIDHFDVFKSKLFYAINTHALYDISIQLPTMDQLVKAVNLIPNVWSLTIGLHDENLAVNADDFGVLTTKIGNKTKLECIYFRNFNLPNNWEKICKENFKNIRYICILKSVLKISINVIDLHDLMTERNISIDFYNPHDDSFVELPEFKHSFKHEEQSSNKERLYILKDNKPSYFQPL